MIRFWTHLIDHLNIVKYHFMLFCAQVPILDSADLGQRNKNSIIKDISLMWLLRVWLQNNNINFWHGSAVVFISTIDQNNASSVGILLHKYTFSRVTIRSEEDLNMI